MKIEKKFSKIIAADLLLFFLFMLIMYALMVGLGLIIFRGDISSLKEIAIVWAFYPLLSTWIQISINRNGVMTISGIDNPTSLIESIEAGSIKLDFKIIERTDTAINFDKKNKWKRFFNIFLRENLKLTFDADKILIYGKRNILTRLEFKIKRDFNLITALKK